MESQIILDNAQKYQPEFWFEDPNAVLSVTLITCIIFGVIFGITTGAVAKYNERSVFAGFMTGFFLGPMGLCTYMIMGESIELRVHLEDKYRSK